MTSATASTAPTEFAEILRKKCWAKDGKLSDVIDVIQGLPADYR